MRTRPAYEPDREVRRSQPAVRDGGTSLSGRAARGALRGVIASMAMTGMREFTRHAGLLEEPPPEAIVRQRLLPGPWRQAQYGRRRAEVEVLR